MPFIEKKLKRIDIVETLTNPEHHTGKVLTMERFIVRHEYEDGSYSRPYTLELVSHKGVDAVGVLPYWEEKGETHVMLLNSFRPAMTLRRTEPLESPYLIEIIAGVVEEGETGEMGVKTRAKEEALEEGGLPIEQADIEILGDAVFSSPGVYTEKFWICAVRVDISKRVTPSLDGSVMEEMIEPFTTTLAHARTLCENGEIRDAKTEIALERLAKKLAS